MDKISKSEYDLKYYESNREKIRDRQKEHYKLNKHKYAKYYNDNKENILSKQSLYHKNKRQSDSTYRFIYNLRIRQKQVLKGISSTTKGLGCNYDELKIWMESKFIEGMSWDNYGNKEGCWSNDHIIPLSSYKKDANGNWDVDSDYNKKLIHYTNLQPMWHIENIKKGNKQILNQNK